MVIASSTASNALIMYVLLYGQMSSFASIPKQFFVRFFAPSHRERWLCITLAPPSPVLFGAGLVWEWPNA
jgi:hypothetical protein